MPLARYFLFVGGILLALLFAIDAGSPELPVAERTDTAVGFPAQRIKSDRKWPEPVVIDTSLPTVVPAQTVAAAPPVAAQPEMSATARARESFAQAQPVEEKKPEAKPPPKRKYAKRRVAPQMMVVEQRPRFGFFGFDTW